MAAYPQSGKAPAEKIPRISKLRDAFQAKYGSPPAFYARAPGRVNLIGEHIDYCGYAVLPMAIEQDIIIAAKSNDENKIILANTEGQFSDFSISTSSVAIDKSSLRWYNYFLCGYKGIMEHCTGASSTGMNLLMDGTVPKGSGLSSSSAFVCCSGLTTMQLIGEKISKLELADICTRCERYIGTEGGGMDQSISFLAEPGTAKLIEFNPLKATSVTLPAGAVFVISNSLVEVNKADSSNFNVRVVECRLATQIIAKSKGLDWRTVKKLGDLQKALGASLPEMLKLVAEVLHEEPYTKEEVCGLLGISNTELETTSLNPTTLNVNSFKLFQRATHVYGEANRVFEFKATCDNQPEGALQQLGELMNGSHARCRDLYECSHPDLDRLVKLCLSSGALGSKLTGAGWGGCAVSLVPEALLEGFMAKVTEGYYAIDERKAGLVKESLFATAPGGGATIYVD